MASPFCIAQLGHTDCSKKRLAKKGYNSYGYRVVTNTAAGDNQLHHSTLTPQPALFRSFHGNNLISQMDKVATLRIITIAGMLIHSLIPLYGNWLLLRVREIK